MLKLALDSPAGPNGQVVSVTGCDPKIVQMPALVTVPPHDTVATVIVAPVAAGACTIIANGSGFRSGRTSVVVSTALRFAPSVLTIHDSLPQNLRIALCCAARQHSPGIYGFIAAPTDLLVHFSASAPGIVAMPDYVRIPQNTTTAIVPVMATGVGTTIITASANLSYISNATATISVTSVQKKGVIALPLNVSLGPGQTAAFPIALP